MEINYWMSLSEEDQERLVETEKLFQLEPDEIYLGVVRTRPLPEHLIDDII